MIKIIKRGTRDISECNSCGCLFSFDEDDTLFINNLDDGKYVKCPQCDNKVILGTKKRNFGIKTSSIL